MDDIVCKLKDLIKQATHERSHYYVAATAREALAEITRLRSLVNQTEYGLATDDKGLT